MTRRLTIIILAVLLLGMTGCATHKAGYVPIKDVSQYVNYQKLDDIEAAADLYADEMKTKEGFYINVNEKNFYPVNLTIKNNSETRLLVYKNSVQLIDGLGNQYSPTSCSIMSGEFEHNKMAYALLGFGIFSYMSAEDANKKMESDWRDKELPGELIINPRQRNSGFVYFKLPEGSKPNGMTLKLTIETMETRKQYSVELRL
jgi:hypothetical protein